LVAVLACGLGSLVMKNMKHCYFRPIALSNRQRMRDGLSRAF
jgi:hypothetical protein